MSEGARNWARSRPIKRGDGIRMRTVAPSSHNVTVLCDVSEYYYATNSKMTPQTVAVTPAISCGLRSSFLRNARLNSRVTNG